MSVHLIREIRKIQKYILNLGAMVEDAMRTAVMAMEDRDPNLAEQVIAGDKQIDLMEIEVEEACLAALALNQPVAHDLRYVIASLKINHNLERVGDLAASIAKQALALSNEPALPIREFGISEMMKAVQAMLKDALDAYVKLDEALAVAVRKADDRVDDLHRDMYAQLEQRMRGDPDRIDSYVRLLNTARQLERAADHTCNIAKDVIYMIRGEIVRHQGKQKDAAAVSEAHEMLTGAPHR